MANYTHELSTEYVFPNISVYKKLKDGVQYGWRVNANEGYVIYDPNAPQIELDENENEITVFYYYTIKQLPLSFDFSTFPWVAVPRDSVDENYIFGGGDNNNHEIM